MNMATGMSRNLVIDIAPLWEAQFTGISNVVCEVASRALVANEPGIDFRFSAFERMVDSTIVEKCIVNKNGSAMHAAFHAGDAIHIDQCRSITPSRDLALFLHLKPPARRFLKEGHLYYDLSYLTVPETHSDDTVRYHSQNLPQQIETTDQFFAISRSTALDLQWFFDIPEEKIKVTYIGHNTDLTLANEFLARSFGRVTEPYMVILGTIEPRKNVSLVLEWLARNNQAMDGCRFIFCGREGWGPTFADLIAQHGLNSALESGRIAHLGYVSQKQKAALIASAEALIYPSLFEGFGLPVLEAMAQSVPVLASCSSSIPEVLGEDGIYFDPYSLQSFTDAFAQLVQERRSGKLSERVRKLKIRSDRFSYDVMFREMVDAMTALVK